MGLFETTGEWSVALGKTLVHSIWMGYLILFILRLLLRSLSSHLSLLRYRISTLMLFLFSGLVTALFLSIYLPDTQSAPSQFSLFGFSAVINQGTADHTSNAGPSAEWIFYLLCCYCYFTGVMVMLIRTLLFFRQARRLKKSGVAVEEEWHVRFNRLKERIGVKNGVTLFASSRIRTPAVVGLIKPMILVPLGMFSQLSVQQVETILLHELYHFKRRDFLVNLIQLFLENLFFYHPAVWAISGMIRTEREHCCDDLVLHSCNDPFHYARALMQLAGSQYAMNNMVTGAGGQDHYQLLNRIRRIFKLKIMKTNLREKLYALMLLAGGLLILFTVSGFTSGFSIIRNHDLVDGTILVPAGTEAEQEQINILQKMDTIPLSGQEPQEGEMEDAQREALESINWDELKKEMEQARQEAMESIDWEALKKEMEEARKEVMDEIDWEALKKEMEEARKEAMEDIDWEALKKEMEEARKEAMEDIDWDALKKEMEEARKEAMEEVDWEALKKEMEMARQEAMEAMESIDLEAMKKELEGIDWEQIRKEIEQSTEDIDWEKIQEDIQRSMQEIDWEKYREEMEKIMIQMDSVLKDMDI